MNDYKVTTHKGTKIIFKAKNILAALAYAYTELFPLEDIASIEYIK